MDRHRGSRGIALLGALCVVLALAGGVVGFVHLAPETALETMQQAQRWRAGLKPKRTTVDGLEIAYLDGGTGEPLLLLHGFGGDKDAFAQVAAPLTRHYRVIIPDLPGFGESSRPESIGYGIDEQAVRLYAFARQLGLRSFALGGNSMGGWIAGTCAARYPDAVTSLWLLDPAGVAGAPQSELMRRVLAAPPGTSPMVPTSVEELEAMLPLVMAEPPYFPRPLLRVLAERSAQHAALLRSIQQQILESAPLEQRVDGIRTPTLIVWGDQDAAVDVGGAQILQRALPHSQVRIMTGVGHVPMMERPEQTAADYLVFRTALDSSSGSRLGP